MIFSFRSLLLLLWPSIWIVVSSSGVEGLLPWAQQSVIKFGPHNEHDLRCLNVVEADGSMKKSGCYAVMAGTNLQCTEISDAVVKDIEEKDALLANTTATLTHQTTVIDKLNTTVDGFRAGLAQLRLSLGLEPMQPIALSSATSDMDGFTMFGGYGPYGVKTFTVGNEKTYAIVSAHSNSGLQFIDVTDPTNPIAVGSASNGVNGFTALSTPNEIAIFTVGDGKTYAIVTDQASHGVQFVDITDPTNPIAVGSAMDGSNGFTTLNGAHGVTTFTVGDGKVYAIVAAFGDNGLQFIDVTDPTDPIAVGSATDEINGFTALAYAYDVVTFVLGDGKVYAIVAGHIDDAVQFIDVTDPTNPIAVGIASDGVNGFTQLNGPIAIATFTVGDGKTYAIVSAHVDNAVQLMDITDPTNPIALGSAAHGVNGYTLYRTRDVEVFTGGDGNKYAIVAQQQGNSIQLIDVTDPTNPIPVGSASDGTNGFSTLDDVRGVHVFTTGDGKTYAIATGHHDSGVQLMTFFWAMFPA